MLGQLSASQFAIDAALAELGNADPATRVELRRQIGLIAGLCQQIGTAQGGALASLRSEAAMLIGNTNAAVQEARANAAAGSTSAIGMAMYANAARDQVNTVMAGMKDFDPYLKFASPDDEAAYRQREDERRAYIAAEQAKHTPQGDLNAAGGAVGQMADAAAHGAGDSPEFQQRWDALVASTEKLRDAAKANGVSTEEFDRRLREDLRRILKSKGLSDAQIDAQFAAHPDPLEAVKAYVGGDVGTVDRAVQRVGDQSASSPKSAEVQATSELAATDPMAMFRASGIVLADAKPSTDFAHGVAVQRSASASRSVPS